MEFTLCSEMSVHSGLELEFENVGFWREERPGVPGEKPLVEYQQHTRPTYDAGSWNSGGGGEEWEASALTNAPSLLPEYSDSGLI